MSFDCKCMKCGLKDAELQYGDKMYCEDCGTQLSKDLYQATLNGAKVLDDKKKVEDGMEIPFPKNPKPEAKQVIGCEVVFVYNDDTRRLVRTVTSEQIKIVKGIVDNRREAKREFQFMDIELAPAGMMNKMNELILAVADGKEDAVENCKRWVNPQ